MTFDDNTFGAIVGGTVAAYGLAYLVAKGLEGLHRRKVERREAFEMLRRNFGSDAAITRTPQPALNQTNGPTRVADQGWPIKSSHWTGRR